MYIIVHYIHYIYIYNHVYIYIYTCISTGFLTAEAPRPSCGPSESESHLPGSGTWEAGGCSQGGSHPS